VTWNICWKVGQLKQKPKGKMRLFYCLWFYSVVSHFAWLISDSGWMLMLHISMNFISDVCMWYVGMVRQLMSSIHSVLPSVCFLSVTECPLHGLATIGGRAFPVAAALTWNSLPQCVTSSVFRGRLKAFLFRRSFPWLLPQLSSACAVTAVIFRHFNCSFFLSLPFCGNVRCRW